MIYLVDSMERVEIFKRPGHAREVRIDELVGLGHHSRGLEGSLSTSLYRLLQRSRSLPRV